MNDVHLQQLSNANLEMADEPNGLSHLWAAATLQDSLLQSYRMISLTIQAILLAVGAALVTIVSRGSSLMFWVVVAIAIAATCISIGLLRIVQHRAASVSHIHRRIVITERQMPLRQRAMTLQKLYQQRLNVSADVVEVLFDDGEAAHVRVRSAAEELVSGGFFHTRASLDRLTHLAFDVAWAVVVFIVYHRVFP